MKAREFHSSMPGYRPTPLVDLPAVATELAVGAVLVKDESERLGLPAFKILGASWAVNCALSKHGGYAEPATNLADLRSRIGNAPVTLVTATDGNHGRAVARMAHHLGLAARIYVPAGTSEKTLKAIAGEGVKVVETELRYDDVVRTAASSTANKPDEILIQDTAWPGYEEIPQWIVDGYDTMFSEIDAQLGERVPDLIAVPTGVGSLLLAALRHCPSTSSGQMWTSSGHTATRSGHMSTRSGRGPAVLAVEPVDGRLRHREPCGAHSDHRGHLGYRLSWPGSIAAPSPPSPGPSSATSSKPPLQSPMIRLASPWSGSTSSESPPDQAAPHHSLACEWRSARPINALRWPSRRTALWS